MATRQRVTEAKKAGTEALHTKYRPRRLGDVIGQPDVVKSLKQVLAAASTTHVFLFTGPPGTGKTTFGHIIAAHVGAGPEGIIEVDAASKSGIDDMRELTDGLKYQGFGDNPAKVIILNECQGLSKQAWDSLLETTENPPPHVYFIFTSTNPEKIPKAMVTRAVTYHLRELRFADLMDVLVDVCEDEGLQTPNSVLELVAKSCEGSARMALTMLAKVSHCADDIDAEPLLEGALENSEVIELCRLLMSGKLDWPRVQSVIKGLPDNTPAETVRIMIVNYLNACALGAKSDKDAMRVLDMLRHFTVPCNPSDKFAQVLLSLGRYVFD